MAGDIGPGKRMRETTIVTRDTLEIALKKWRETAAAEGWPERDDHNVDRDNADYLFDLLNV